MSLFKVIIVMKNASFFRRKKPNVTYIFRISCELSTWSACPTTSVGTCWRATLTGRCMCGVTGGTRSPTSSNTATTYVHDCAVVCWCWPKTGTLIVLIYWLWLGMTLHFYLLFPAVCLLVCCCLFVRLLLFCYVFCLFLFFCFFLFVCCLTSRSRIFHLCGDVTIAAEGNTI